MLLVVFVRTVGVDKVLFLFAENLLTVSFCTEPYTTPWVSLKRAAGCNMDNTMIAEKFRAWCASKGMALDARNIEQAFSNFCGKVGRV